MTPLAAHGRWFRAGLSCLILALAAACYLPPPTAPEGGCARPDNLQQVSGGKACFATVTVLATAPASDTLLIHVDGNNGAEMWADLSSPRASERYLRWFYGTNPLRIPWEHVTKVAFVQPKGVTPEWGQDMGSSCRFAGYCYRNENAEALAEAIRNLKTRHAAKRLIYVGYSGGATMGGILAGMAPNLEFEEMILVIEPYGRWQEVENRAIAEAGEQYSVLEYVSRIPNTTRIAVVLGAKGWSPVDPADEIDYYRKLEAEGLEVTLYDLRDRMKGPDLLDSRALHSRPVKQALTDAIERTTR